MFKLGLLCLLFGLAPATWAARPFVTDDARLTLAGSCQMESWTRLYRGSTEVWATPACNPTGNLEFTVGGGLAGAKGGNGEWSNDYVFQAKTLFKTLETNSWGVGIAVGTILHPKINPGPNLLGNTYAYMPLSFSLADDLVVIHSNVGWIHDKASSRDQTSWGLGSEINLNQRVTLIAENFGSSGNTPYWQTGVRYSIVPNLWQVDSTIGRQFGGNSETRWLSFGLRFTPASLF